MSTDVNDLLMSGGRTAKFPTIGTTIEGTITELVSQQATTIDGTPETWPSGEPKMQIVVTLATAEREGDDDDGSRKLYVKGNLFAELRNAVKASGQKLAVGGTLKVAYVADGEPPQRGYSAPKLYKVKYTPGTTTVDLDDF